MPPSGVKLSCMLLTAPQRRVGGDGGEQRRVGDAEADLLALHVAAGCSAIDADRRRRAVGIAGRLGPVGDRRRRRGTGCHRRARAPSPAGCPAPCLPKRVGQRRRGSAKMREHLEEVRERRRVLEGMRRVGVEEAAAVGAELLDDLLRRHRALRDRLCRALDASSHARVGVAGSAARPARRATARRATQIGSST